MRIVLSALIAFEIYTTGALAGGGTVTSTEVGPPTLAGETIEQMLDTTGIVDTTGEVQTELATVPALVVHLSPPPAPFRTEVTPPPNPNAHFIIYASPPTAPPKATDEETKADQPSETSKTVKAALGPVNPREVVRSCATCHGYDGIAKIPTAPNIAGSSRQYLESQLKAFRSGKRENEVMSVIAQDLSNAEIKAAAKWYAGLKITVEGAE